MGSVSCHSLNMKVVLVLALFLAVAAAEVSKAQISKALIQNGQDGCLTRVDDIMKAVADCSNSDVDLLTCITEAIGAASDCFHCICEVLAIIGGFDDVCP